MGDGVISVVASAIAIAISPLSLAAVLALVLARRGASSAPGFLVAWAVWIAVLVAGSAGVAAVLTTDRAAVRVFAAWVEVVAAGLLLVLAVLSWRARPTRGGGGDEVPRWLIAADAYGFGGGMRVGTVFSIANPKVVLVAITTGLLLPTLPNSTGLLAGILFWLVSISTVFLSAAAAVVIRRRDRPWLDSARAFLIRYAAVTVTVILLVVAVLLAADGLTALR